MLYVVDLAAAGPQPDANLGGKASALSRLIHAGLPVPRSLCLTASAYHVFTDQPDLRDVIRTFTNSPSNQAEVDEASAAVQRAFNSAPMPPEIENEIREAAGRLLSADGRALAVRSSALAEDQINASFAGQHASFLCIRDESAALAAVRRCWASLWSPEAISYRRRLAAASDHGAMAVVLQAMLYPDWAGVLFTVNPVSGNPNQLLVNAVRGLGEPLVAGLVTPHEWAIDKRTGDIEVIRASPQEEQLICGASGPVVTRIPVDETMESNLSLHQLGQLRELGTRLETLFGGPQDVEWAFMAGDLYVLQSRPITALPRFDLAGDRNLTPIPGYWTRLGFGEWFQSPASPLFATALLPRMNDEADALVAQRLGLRRKSPSWTIIGGYYYVRGSIAITRSMAAAPWRLVENWRAVASAWSTDVLPRFATELPQLTSFSAEGATTQAIADHLDAAAAACADMWAWIIITALCAKSTEAAFAFLCRLFLDRSGKLATELLSGFPNASVEADESLWALANQARAIPDVRRAIQADASLESMRLAIKAAAPEWTEALDEWIGRYGHRVLDLDLAEMTLAENPRLIPYLLRMYLDTPSASPGVRHDRTIARRDAAEATFRDRLQMRPRPVRRLMRWLLDQAAEYARIRENRPFYLHMLWPIMRQDALEIGRRLAASGFLRNAEDVFYLTWEELQTRVQSAPEPGREEATYETEQFVDARRLRRTSDARRSPVTHVPAGRLMRALMEWRKRRQTVDASIASVFLGTPGSPGMTEGVTRVMTSPNEWGRFEPGAILVAPFTTPAWTALLSTAAGVITEHGGSLCHAAIVAREYGIPAVVGVQDATTRIRDGAWATLDGSNGKVRIAPL